MALSVARLLEANQSALDCFQMRNLSFYFFGLCFDLVNDLGAELVRVESKREERFDF